MTDGDSIKSLIARIDSLVLKLAGMTYGSDGKTRVTGNKDGSSANVDSPLSIQWEDSKNRKPVSMPLPVVPDWVAKQGVRLSVGTVFTLTPQGFLTGIKVEKSSGYMDVDAAVMDALRKWKFEAVGGGKNVKGRITYIISVH
jgi:TonB family protein